MTRVPSLMLAFVVAAPLAAPLAAQELTSDRPDFTESAVVVKRAQLETGYTFTRSSATRQHSFGEVLLRLGLVKGIELRLAGNSYVSEHNGLDNPAGFEDVSIGAKLALTREPGVALIISAGIPTGTDAVGGGFGVAPEILLAIDRDLSERVSFGTNASIASVPDAAGRNATVSGSAVVGLATGTKTGVFGEVYGSRTVSGAASSRDYSAYADTGLTYGVTADFQLDARVGTRLGARLGSTRVRGTEWFFGIGAVRRWR